MRRCVLHLQTAWLWAPGSVLQLGPTARIRAAAQGQSRPDLMQCLRTRKGGCCMKGCSDTTKAANEGPAFSGATVSREREQG